MGRAEMSKLRVPQGDRIRGGRRERPKEGGSRASQARSNRGRPKRAEGETGQLDWPLPRKKDRVFSRTGVLLRVRRSARGDGMVGSGTEEKRKH